ncbi:hypothetical protein EDC96DRAFT_584615 [Choanephora cucurbitarum]|nr:hypothetical protein EDC96DRAFT_584615 [Choanephora cucurbitarum]
MGDKIKMAMSVPFYLLVASTSLSKYRPNTHGCKCTQHLEKGITSNPKASTSLSKYRPNTHGCKCTQHLEKGITSNPKGERTRQRWRSAFHTSISLEGPK